MDYSKSSLNFITCEQLRAEFAKCVDEINKRVLIIDVRNQELFKMSHLCLDHRNSLSSVSSKMHVINIDPDRLTIPTMQNVISLLEGKDLRIMLKRRDATDVILIESDTDNLEELKKPSSKTTRVINSLTKFDNKQSDKIVVPIQILKGGYREWIHKYPHFTTNPHFEPDAAISHSKTPTSVQSPDSGGDLFKSEITRPVSPVIMPTVKLSPSSSPSNISKPSFSVISKPVPPIPPKVMPAIPKVAPSTPTASKPIVIRNAPGTAVPVSPIQSLRTSLPRSQSSPNVAQADGDELETASQLNRLDLVKYDGLDSSNNNNNIPGPIPSKPRFDRTLKPNFNREAVNAIRAHLDFGRSPEATDKPITGLQNLGNTCFMNSVVQCLTYTQKLASYFCYGIYYNDVNFSSQDGTKGELAIEFGALVEKLSAHRYRYIEPKSFRDTIARHFGFTGNEQQDSHEFMMKLFDKLHHDLNEHAKDKFRQNGLGSNYISNGNSDDSNINISRATLGNKFWTRHLELNKSIVSELFEGIFMSTLTCSYCKGQSNTFEVFNCLALQIPPDSTCQLRDCLSHFSNPERIDAAWECPRCKQKREADKKIVMCKLPQILVIHLKRFSIDGKQKLQTAIDFPLNDLRVDCTDVLPQSAYKLSPNKNSYNLYGVVNHYGHLNGGHYTAFCKLENQRWYKFDDNNVTEMRDSEVCTRAAYILFYSANG